MEKYKKYFKVPRACNQIVWKWLKLSKHERMNALKEFKTRKGCSQHLQDEINEI